jgi:hypothetical protein
MNADRTRISTAETPRGAKLRLNRQGAKSAKNPIRTQLSVISVDRRPHNYDEL